MQVTEVRVKLMGRKSERLKAFCSVTFDRAFVIRDVKVIDGTNGLFVAMPSRQLSDRCPSCHNKNTLRAKFCSECGGRLDESRVPRNGQGRLKLHVDIAHPINVACRESMEKAILEAYQNEVQESERPDYKPQHLDVGEEEHGQVHTPAATAPVNTPSAAETQEPTEQASVQEPGGEQETKDHRDTNDGTEEHKFGEGLLQ